MGTGKRSSQSLGGRLFRATTRQRLPTPHRPTRLGLPMATHHLALLAGPQALLRTNLSGRSHARPKSTRQQTNSASKLNVRSEERRVGKEGRTRWAQPQEEN